MIYLLDTHYLLWSITDTKKIPVKVQQIITDVSNEIVISAISLWEISLKFSMGKLHIEGFGPQELPVICKKMGFSVIPLSPEVCCSYHLLSAHHHKDPFDRMLIWESISNQYVLLSADANMKKYRSAGLRLLD